MESINKIVRLAESGKLGEAWDDIRSSSEKIPDPDTVAELRELVERDQETLVKQRPVLGSTRWDIDEIVSLGNAFYALSLQDGHILRFLVVEYDDEELRLIAESE